MSEWLTGKVVLVTGAASGIGKAIVNRFLQEGARVGALDRDGAALARLARRSAGRVIAIRGDVTRLEDNERAVQRTVKAWGKLDVFVGNAGIFDGFVRLADLPAPIVEDAFEEVFATNVKGYMLGAKATMKELLRSQGTMIFTVSSAGLYAGAGGTIYSASKHAVVGLIRQLAFELAPKVRVNGVAPGGTLTNLRVAQSVRRLVGRADHANDREKKIRKANPLHIVMQPEDHTPAYVLLASDQARAITGIVVESDGGLGVRGLWKAAGGQDL